MTQQRASYQEGYEYGKTYGLDLFNEWLSVNNTSVSCGNGLKINFQNEDGKIESKDAYNYFFLYVDCYNAVAPVLRRRGDPLPFPEQTETDEYYRTGFAKAVCEEMKAFREWLLAEDREVANVNGDICVYNKIDKCYTNAIEAFRIDLLGMSVSA